MSIATFKRSAVSTAHIGLDARDGSGVCFDNFVIETNPESGVAVLGALGTPALLCPRSREFPISQIPEENR